MRVTFLSFLLLLCAASSPIVAQSQKPHVDCFVRATLQPEELTVGDSAVIVYRLFATAPAAQVQLKTAPKGKGLHLRPLHFNPDRTWQRVLENGKLYYVITVAQYVVTLADGKMQGRLTASEVAATFRFRRSSGDPFADFFGGGATVEVEATAKSEPIDIKAKEKRRRTMQEILPEGLI